MVEINGRIGTIVDLHKGVAVVQFPNFYFEGFAAEQLKVVWTARAEQVSPAN